jgi:hypothetical protein
VPPLTVLLCVIVAAVFYNGPSKELPGESRADDLVRRAS